MLSKVAQRYRILKNICVALGIFLTSCATVSPVTDLKHSIKSDREILQATPHVLKEEIRYFNTLKQKIFTFRQILNSGQPLTGEDWRLHDELLDALIYLKSVTIDNKIVIPSRSRKSVPIQTFCLNPGISPPMRGEKFVWRTDDTEIPYFRNVISYAVKHPEISQAAVQTLIWNLKRGARWENYPKGMQSILLSIDLQAPFKLPSNIKDRVKSKAANAITDKLKELGLWRNTQDLMGWVKGEYRDFDSIHRQLLNLKSKFPLVSDNSLVSIPGIPLFVDTQTNSYSSHIITFYNPTNAAVTVDLGNYYMQSKRPDVQRMALKKIIPPELTGVEGLGRPPIVQDLENVLYTDMLRLGLGFVPVVGDAVDLYELFNGKDFVSEEELSWQGRLLSGLGLIAGSGAGYRYALRVIHSPAEYIGKFENGLSQALGKKVVFNKQGIDKAGRTLFEVRGDIVRESRLVSHDPPSVGQKVYRIYGQDIDKNIDVKGALPFGSSWTPLNPNSLPNARGSLGLPNQNRGRFVIEGRIIDAENIKVKSADELHGNPGQGTEYLIPDPKSQIKIEKVSAVNPEF